MLRVGGLAAPTGTEAARLAAGPGPLIDFLARLFADEQLEEEWLTYDCLLRRDLAVVPLDYCGTGWQPLRATVPDFVPGRQSTAVETGHFPGLPGQPGMPEDRRGVSGTPVFVGLEPLSRTRKTDPGLHRRLDLVPRS